MKIRISIDHLTPGQWGWLEANVPHTRTFPEGAVRMCVQMDDGCKVRHVEMPPREFISMIERLWNFTRTVEAALSETPGTNKGEDSKSRTCPHGCPLNGDPSIVGPFQVFTYLDGCQEYERTGE